MRAVVVFESIFGNTRDVAFAVVDGLRDAGVNAHAVEVSGAPAPDDCDLLVVGGPTHAWSMTRANTREDARRQAHARERAPVSTGIGVREWLAQRVVGEGRGRMAAAFDTAVSTKWMPTGSAAKAIAKSLARCGYRVIGHGEQFFVADTDGPLVDGELGRARAWGALVGRRAQPPEARPVS